MVFNPNIPQPGDLLSSSQGGLLANNGFLQTWSVTDHYGLDDNTVNNGKHQVLQMPVQANQPVSVNDPLFYSFQQATGNAGILQYMVQAGGFVASPITPIQSSSAGITLAPGSIPSPTTTTLMDFTSMPFCFGWMNGFAQVSGSPPTLFGLAGWFYWNGSLGIVLQSQTTGLLAFRFSGSLFQIANSSAATFTSVAWTFGFDRIFTPL